MFVQRGHWSVFIDVCISGVVRTFWNPNNASSLNLETTVTPAGSSEKFYRTYCGLAMDSGSIDLVSPLQMMVTYDGANMRLATVPFFLWVLLRHTVIPALKLLGGYAAFYPEYTG